MDCSICFDKVNNNIYKCGFNHSYHIRCFNKLNHTDKCIICYQYVTICIDNAISSSNCKKLINQGEKIGFTKTQNNKIK